MVRIRDSVGELATRTAFYRSLTAVTPLQLGHESHVAMLLQRHTGHSTGAIVDALYEPREAR